MKHKLLLLFFVAFFSFAYSSNSLTEGAPDWAQKPGLQYSAALNAQIYKDGVLYMPTNALTLAVFKGEECRGVRNVYSGSTIKILRVTYGSNLASETGLKLKVYDPNTDKVYDIVEEITFTNGVSIATPSEPMKLTIITTALDNPTLTSEFSVFPNPVNDVFQLKLNSDNPTNAKIDLYELQGKFVQTIYNGAAKSDKLVEVTRDKNISNGIYFLKATIDDKQYITKVILM